MTFESEKKKYLEELYKPDRSKKGGVDMEIAHLIDIINKSDNYYTTSSCAGRILLLKVPKSGKKHEAEWPFVSHEEVKYEAMKPAIERLKADAVEEPVWFRQESPIFHIAARTLEDGQKILDMAKLSGFKRSGIMATNKRIMVELMSTEFVDTIISKEGRILVSEEYLEILVDEANKKLRRARAKAEKFYELMKGIKLKE